MTQYFIAEMEKPILLKHSRNATYEYVDNKWRHNSWWWSQIFGHDMMVPCKEISEEEALRRIHE